MDVCSWYAARMARPERRKVLQTNADNLVSHEVRNPEAKAHENDSVMFLTLPLQKKNLMCVVNIWCREVALKQGYDTYSTGSSYHNNRSISRGFSDDTDIDLPTESREQARECT